MSPSSWEDEDSDSWEGGYVDSDCSRDPFSDSSDEDDVVKDDEDDEDSYSTQFYESPKPQSLLHSIMSRHPLAKRQKTETEQDSSCAEDETTTANLSLLPSMPLDVQQEIFSKLSPKEVLNVARTTKTLRAQLMTKKATTVWKMARENSSIPDCPPWFSEPAWANLLFGNTCKCCGAKNTSRVDIMILERLCHRCKAKHLIKPDHPMTLSLYRNVNPSLFDLLPVVQNSGGRKFIWAPDLEVLNRREVILQKKINKGSTKAQGALSLLHNQQLAKCAYLEAHFLELEAWRTRYLVERGAELSGRIERRRSQIQQRMINLGYLEKDIESLDRRLESQTPHDLTEQEWDVMEPVFVAEATQERDERLHREAHQLRCTLLSLIEERYLVYKKTEHPSKWKYLPPTQLLVVMDPFFSCLTTQTPIEYSPEAVDDWFQNSLAQAKQRRISQLSALLPTLETSPQTSESTGPTTQTSLELATSVFRCGQGCYLFGDDDVVSHHCGSGITASEFKCWVSRARFAECCANKQRAFEKPAFQYASKAAAVVAKVVKFVGLDPTVATVSELDTSIAEWKGGATLRFKCDDCSAVNYQQRFHKPGYDWRSLATHLDQTGHNPSHSIVELPRHRANECRDHEIQACSIERAWVCTHCTLHADDPQTKADIIQHLIKVHAIARPTEPHNFLIGDTTNLRRGHYGKYDVCSESEAIPRPSAYVSTHARCLLCTDMKGKARVFKVAGVVAHLKSRHSVVAAKARTDFEYIIFK